MSSQEIEEKRQERAEAAMVEVLSHRNYRGRRTKKCISAIESFGKKFPEYASFLDDQLNQRDSLNNNL